MSKTTNLKTHLTALLKTVNENVYFEEASSDAKFPYLVYELSDFSSENRTDYLLEINVWDKNKKTINVETIADELEKLLDHYNYIDKKMQFRIYKNTRNNIRDQNKQLKRRRLLFNLLFYERSSE